MPTTSRWCLTGPGRRERRAQSALVVGAGLYRAVATGQDPLRRPGRVTAVSS
jgi:hypothetical protein